MNVVREINKINEKELQLGLSGVSWHDDYKDSAYIYVGGLHLDMTEGDVITIFSQYGEGLWLFNVLERVLRVDHVKNYKQPKVRNEDGEFVEQEEQSLNAKPQIIEDNASSESEVSSGPEIDPEDPMASYLLEKRREEKAKRKKKSKKHKDETPEERKVRKERKREKKALKASKKSSGLKGVEALLQSWKSAPAARSPRSRSQSPPRRSRSPGDRSQDKHKYEHRDESPKSRSPGGEHRRRRDSRERRREEYDDHRYDRRSERHRQSDHSQREYSSRSPPRGRG
ncbi:RNA-binding Cwf29 [Pyrrhoderma noxium]|uniref:RNA-binding Cwf29 n=1 Tax=Pyrrhoderma noxium TaxID=2282107 RepID=A0A286UN39_9AGAM|nr:RNA-binding Cwf29 [Pyrrhoderma noxium]